MAVVEDTAVVGIIVVAVVDDTAVAFMAALPCRFVVVTGAGIIVVITFI